MDRYQLNGLEMGDPLPKPSTLNVNVGFAISLRGAIMQQQQNAAAAAADKNKLGRTSCPSGRGAVERAAPLLGARSSTRLGKA